ncbi:MAG: IPT/TIG domain-containing protein [Cyanobacteria bacterium P01_G01_bin.67]
MHKILLKITIAAVLIPASSFMSLNCIYNLNVANADNTVIRQISNDDIEIIRRNLEIIKNNYVLKELPTPQEAPADLETPTDPITYNHENLSAILNAVEATKPVSQVIKDTQEKQLVQFKVLEEFRKNLNSTEVIDGIQKLNSIFDEIDESSNDIGFLIDFSMIVSAIILLMAASILWKYANNRHNNITPVYENNFQKIDKKINSIINEYPKINKIYPKKGWKEKDKDTIINIQGENLDKVEEIFVGDERCSVYNNQKSNDFIQVKLPPAPSLEDKTVNVTVKTDNSSSATGSFTYENNVQIKLLDDKDKVHEDQKNIVVANSGGWQELAIQGVKSSYEFQLIQYNGGLRPAKKLPLKDTILFNEKTLLVKYPSVDEFAGIINYEYLKIIDRDSSKFKEYSIQWKSH